MTEFSTDFLRIIEQVLPGFLVAWIVYGLTAYSKPSPFERVVQALIFTILVRGIAVGIREISLLVGRCWGELGIWSDDSSLVTSIIVSVIMGVGLAWCVNHDYPFSKLRPYDPRSTDMKLSLWRRFLNYIRLTEKTMHPSEWYTAFSTNNSYIVLHLVGGRRLFGWPVQYPDNPAVGHFLISETEWLLDSGDRVPLYTVECMLIRVVDVESVEFVKDESEVTATVEDQKRAQEMLVKIQDKISHEEDQDAD